MSDKILTGKAAIVTGGGRGIGAEITRVLAPRGVAYVNTDGTSTSTITVQLKDAGGTDLTVSGGTGALCL